MEQKGLEDLPIELFIQQLTYLPFKDVVSLCQSSRELNRKCTDPRYNRVWKRLIDDTFQNYLDDYPEKLNEVWTKLGIERNTFNYMVYTQLVNYLHPITQLMIYYVQDDQENFNSGRYDIKERFLALFLLKKIDEMRKYLPNENYLPFIDILEGGPISDTTLNNMFLEMGRWGYLKGILMFLNFGADIQERDNEALRFASKDGYLDIVKYLVEHGADIHAVDEEALRAASNEGHLDVVKYLVEQGADVHGNDDEALKLASLGGYLDIVKYLVENGANIHAGNNAALVYAAQNGHLDVIKYLVERGINLNILGRHAALMASLYGHQDVANYLRRRL